MGTGGATDTLVVKQVSDEEARGRYRKGNIEIPLTYYPECGSGGAPIDEPLAPFRQPPSS